ncbi:MAG: protein kinase [Verrucomicrobiota bacterium]
MKVIVADDDPVSRMVLLSTLKSANYELIIFSDGRSLWDSLPSISGPKIILLDWVMPGYHGPEICRKLQDSPQRSLTYVIMLSAYDEMKSVIYGLDSGADDYLAKPVRKGELLARLRVAERTLAVQEELSNQIKDLENTINGRYQMFEEIGSGGLGAVYRGKDRILQRPVAIKLLKNSIANSDIWAKAKSEAMLTATIQHRNIIDIYDCGRNAEGAYVVMELFDGQNLEDFMNLQAQIPLGLFEIFAREMMLGLMAAHDHNILHCDIKPSNVMVRLCGPKMKELEVRILDFGLAKLHDQAKENTDDCIMASVFYLSPELIIGDPLDARSDLYSLGFVFYHLLAGTPAYNEETVDGMLRAHLKGEYIDICEFNPEVSPELRSWLKQLMARRPDDRFQSTEEALLAFNKISTVSEFRAVGAE